MAKEIKISDLINKIRPAQTTTRRRHLEINLVPDIKDEMIKTLKLRNFIFFICIVISSVGVGASLIILSIAGGQQAVVDAKKGTLSNLSQKLQSYSDLSDFLTIRDQLGNLSEISQNKKVLSRIFNIITVLFPSGPNGDIKMSELNINLEGSAPTISFDAQANAPGGDNGIDYNVLDSFKKSMQYMGYDYGNYVDKEGNTIPAYCIVENGQDGATLYDSTRGYYAYWLIAGDGCNPAGSNTDDADGSTDPASNTNPNNTTNADTSTNTDATTSAKLYGYDIEQYEGQSAVRIWRTPQFDDWYKAKYMDLDGTIADVPHFDSRCTTYNGVETEVEVVTETGKRKTTQIDWKESNDTCMLVPDGTEGINITDSSNGRGADDELVLRFSAIITLNPDVFKFTNPHVLAVAPRGRYNVTDSYVQIQSMFTERAADCAPTDTACNNTTNLNGGN